jgi:hypothetical protein
MKFISKASEDEMIKLFLETELSSDRFKEKLRTIIEDIENEADKRFTLDCDDKEACHLRRLVLSRYRGYGNNEELFEGFPDIDDWNWVTLTKEDLKRIKYINYSYWIELSKGSRYAVDAVRSIQDNIEVYGVSNEGFIKVADAVKREVTFPPIILVSTYEDPDNMVLVEGHLRLTAYMLAFQHVKSVNALIGYADLKSFKNWGLY